MHYLYAITDGHRGIKMFVNHNEHNITIRFPLVHITHIDKLFYHMLAFSIDLYFIVISKTVRLASFVLLNTFRYYLEH